MTVYMLLCGNLWFTLATLRLTEHLIPTAVSLWGHITVLSGNSDFTDCIDLSGGLPEQHRKYRTASERCCSQEELK